MSSGKLPFLIICLLIPVFDSLSQNQLQPGYFIDNDGVRYSCLIKDTGRKETPSEFSYVTVTNNKLITKQISEVREFGFSGKETYRRFEVQIDRKAGNTSEVSVSKEPQFETDTLWLEVLLEGKASLYEYRKDLLTTFFFGRDSNEVTQLILKKYRIPEGTEANQMYKRQLERKVKCQSGANLKTEKLTYERQDLIDYFIGYNKCSGVDYASIYLSTREIEKKNKNENRVFSISLRGGINRAQLSLTYLPNNLLNVDYKRGNHLRLGVELEYLAPNTEGVLAFFAEPFYSSYKDKNGFFENTPFPNNNQTEAHLQVLGIILGIRNYYHLNSTTALLANAGFSMNQPISSELVMEERTVVPEYITFPSFFIGIGVLYRNLLFLEYRLNTSQNIVSRDSFFMSNYKSQELLLGIKYGF